jgi:hypothetical protein
MKLSRKLMKYSGTLTYLYNNLYELGKERRIMNIRRQRTLAVIVCLTS